MNTLNQSIKDFYDISTELWENFWGEHLHHGYYELGTDIRHKNPQQAQIDLIKQLVTWADLEATKIDNFLDIGCGIGGSSIWLANYFGCHGSGITLSPRQAERARQKVDELGLTQQLSFQVADALAMPFKENTFDLVWSLESGEHMADKYKFIAECYRTLQPKGRLVLATWCHREINDQPLTNTEQQHLQRIYDVYCLPYVISCAEYATIAESIGFRNVKIGDWSSQTAPFWHEVWRTALRPDAVWEILRYGLSTIRSALAIRLMIRGYAMGLVRFGVLTATK